jgi:hypothetical protein
MEEDQAWITYNHGFAAIAEKDLRNKHIRIKGLLKNCTDSGMPTNEEFSALLVLEDALDEKFSAIGGIFVGRITITGHRFFYFYTNISEEKVKQIIDSVIATSGYQLSFRYKEDKTKRYYWEELYPTDEDWQVIKDLDVLDTLAKEGDIKDKAREVEHWAYFPDITPAEKFSQWAIEQKYHILYHGKDDDGIKYLGKYTHVGTMNLEDISGHTLASFRKARELGGDYDGWETSVERE